MTKVQKLTVRLSEIRQRLNEIAGLDETLTDEQRQESDRLNTEYRDMETKLRAATTASDEGVQTRSGADGEARELRALLSGASLADAMSGAVNGNYTNEGQLAEVRAHFGCSPQEIPVQLLETRAVTSAPGEVQQNQDMVIDAVFPRSAAAFMGVDMPIVPTGAAVYPVITNQDAADDYASSGAVTETDGAFTANLLEPRRIQSWMFWTHEDAAKFGGMEDALRRNLSGAVASGIDKYALLENNKGLLDFGTDPTAASGQETFARYMASAYGSVDGRFAGGVNEIRMLLGSSTYSHAGSVYQSNGDMSAAQALARDGVGLRVSAHVAAIVSNQQYAVAAIGTARNAVLPIWTNVKLIRDEVTKAASGQVVLTAIALANFAVLRSDGFKRFRFRVS